MVMPFKLYSTQFVGGCDIRFFLNPFLNFLSFWFIKIPLQFLIRICIWQFGQSQICKPNYNIDYYTYSNATFECHKGNKKIPALLLLKEHDFTNAEKQELINLSCLCLRFPRENQPIKSHVPTCISGIDSN